ncbi:DUF1275 domain-containing protein [Clostridium tyrobutyricum]|uniref:DUF1275 domain-containing protein n=1 Tax=Clostridium tyrobutyricum DIVETGP TaxID=1408889 RepID=W6N7P3_CLOTY|nr:YoaK family protein [Clostridium tyrobutyricum]AND84674.1 hypothetical protein CTK_C14130 [Clostridium tyrobutyricum]ANP69273.1 hypothetical protein BA182_06175 [Clostridium tyrobutyricum]MBV4433329.1 DUF1275 domain-containing protein [Clostridium tyrobutyricum]MBV4450298.1 DUF1275 domain-containing protein [Clostridium tyrobutyricum]MCH4200260.1 DUF1275 domain-containing protein [Clostridium tyrobutyricum]
MTVKEIPVVHKKKISLHYPIITSESLILGILLTTVGGFLDAYTFVGRGGVFSNAQTGNLVLVGISLFKRNWNEFLHALMPILGFIIGVMTYEIIKKRASIAFIKNSLYMILIIEIILFLIIGFIPRTVSNIFVNVTISFAASLQFCSFRKLVGAPFATTMCTGNLRSASHEVYIAITQKDHESSLKAIRYFAVIFSFLFGAFWGGFFTINIGDHSIWVVCIVLLFCLISLIISNQIMNNQND